MDSPMYLLIHVLISVLGIISGLVVAGGMACGRLLGGWNGYFLATTVLTSATGFGFPFVKVLPPHIVGAISLVVQLLQKTPPLAKLAPEGSLAFGVTHLIVLALMGWLGWAAFKGFKDAK